MHLYHRSNNKTETMVNFNNKTADATKTSTTTVAADHWQPKSRLALRFKVSAKSIVKRISSLTKPATNEVHARKRTSSATSIESTEEHPPVSLKQKDSVGNHCEKEQETDAPSEVHETHLHASSPCARAGAHATDHGEEEQADVDGVKIFNELLRHHPLKELLGEVVNCVPKNDGRSKFFGAYELLRPIAEGAFGQVCEARYFSPSLRSKNAKFAIKLVPKAKYASVDKMDHLANEINISKRVNHKNVVSSRDVFHDTNCVCIVMELAAMDLNQYRQEYGYKLEDRCVRSIVKGVLEGLGHLHSNNMAHMDLKGGNILIRRDVPPMELSPNDILLCDLGLSVIGKGYETVSDNTMRGTFGMMAPEVLMGSPAGYDAKCADMWSLGAILMDLIGCTPKSWMDMYSDGISRASFNLVLYNTMRTLQSKLVKRKNPSLSHLILHLLKENPGERWTVKESLQNKWVSKPIRKTRQKSMFVKLLRSLFCSRKQ